MVATARAYTFCSMHQCFGSHSVGDTMNTLDIANQLVELCKQGKNDEAKSLYALDAVSVEAFAPPGMQQETKGLDAIKAKGE